MGVNIHELNLAQRIFLNFTLASLQPGGGREHIRFCQVGANESAQDGDPIHPFIKAGLWKGVMIEPLPHVFEQLTQNMADIEGLILENSAISDHAGSLTLYHPQGRTGLASFDPKTVMSHGYKREELQAYEVPCYPLTELLEKHAMTDLDVLVVDVEGYDATVIQAIDFTKIHVNTLLFEVKHLQEPVLNGLKQFLEARGYMVILMGSDGFATKVAESSRPFFEMLSGIFENFRTMERRAMQHLVLIDQLHKGIVGATPRS